MTDNGTYVLWGSPHSYYTGKVRSYLVKKGLPFRDAHEAVGHAVKAAEQKGVDLPQLTLDELKAFCPQVENDVFSVLTVTGSLPSRNHIGGTAPEQVRAAIQRARSRLKLP
mgnify:CR=1 FL=1